MKVKLFFLLLITCPIFSYSQQPTRNQLFTLYYEANLAANSGNIDSAITKYQEIINLTPRYSDPYLKAAQLCEEHIDKDPKWLETAIVMYRLYLNLELDDTKTNEAAIKLRSLEDKMSISHFDEKLLADKGDIEEYAPGITDNTEESSLETEEDFLDNNNTEEPISNIESNSINDNITEESSSDIEWNNTKEVSDLTINNTNDSLASQSQEYIQYPSEPSVIDNEGTENNINRNSLTTITDSPFVNPYAVEIIPENTLDSHAMKELDLNALCGRWVSLSRMSNGREAWIIDISILHNELRITLNNNSGILNLPQWQQSLLGERSSLLSCANNHSIITTRPDITMGTMKMFNYLQSRVANGAIDENGSISFTYGIDLVYTPTAGKYDIARTGLGILSGLFEGLTGISGLSNITDNAINNMEASDTEINYTGEINFIMNLNEGFMTGSCKELLNEASTKGSHEKKNRVFPVELCKVNRYYAGYQGSPFIKTKEDIKREKDILRMLKKADNDSENKYLLGILYAYNYGEKEIFEIPKYSKKSIKLLKSAAKDGNANALAFLSDYFFKLSLGEKTDQLPQVSISSSLNAVLINASMPPRNVRKSSLKYAEEYLSQLKEIDPARALVIEAEYKINKSYDIDAAINLFQKAASLGNSTAMNRIGEILLYEYNDLDGAINYFSQAANLNNPNAMLNIALLYRDGKGIQQDAVLYITWTLRAYKNGNLAALDELANAYAKGIGVKQDYEQSIKYIDLKRKINYDIYSYMVKKAELDNTTSHETHN